MTARGLERAWRRALAARARLRAQARPAIRPDPGERRLSTAWASATAGPWRRAAPDDLRRAVKAAPAVLLGDFRALPSLTIRLPEVLGALGDAPVLLASGRAATPRAARDPAIAPWVGPGRLLGLLRADLAGPGKAPRLWRRLGSEADPRRSMRLARA